MIRRELDMYFTQIATQMSSILVTYGMFPREFQIGLLEK
jgi:hypothetical protein